jgi:hypothetical protein
MTPNQDMETSNYRYTRRTMWQVLRSRYAAEVADRIDAGDVRGGGPLAGREGDPRRHCGRSCRSC